MVELPFWSDEDRPFVVWALGVAFNAKWLARRFGLIETQREPSPLKEVARKAKAPTREERLADRIEDSRYEDHR